MAHTTRGADTCRYDFTSKRSANWAAALAAEVDTEAAFSIELSNCFSPGAHVTALPVLCACARLERLYLDSNYIDALPQMFTALTALRLLSLRSNTLTALPALDGFRDLSALSLRDCALNTLPALPPALTELDVSGNRLLVVPDSVLAARALKDLRLRSNHLTRLPNSLWMLSNLELLDVRGNKQLRTLPCELAWIATLARVMHEALPLAVPSGGGGASIARTQVGERILKLFAGSAVARCAVASLIHHSRAANPHRIFPRDVARYLGRYIWATRRNPAWHKAWPLLPPYVLSSNVVTPVNYSPATQERVLALAQELALPPSSQRVRRVLVAVVGAPGSGKTTLANVLSRLVGGSVVVSIDGYHLRNAELVECGWRADKGLPHTLDVPRCIVDVQRVREPESVGSFPEYNRALHEPVADAVRVLRKTEVVIVEGHLGYLLPLRDLFDVVVVLDAPLELIRRRLHARNATRADFAEHFARVDAVNAEALKPLIAQAAAGQGRYWHLFRVGGGVDGEAVTFDEVTPPTTTASTTC